MKVARTHNEKPKMNLIPPRRNMSPSMEFYCLGKQHHKNF